MIYACVPLCMRECVNLGMCACAYVCVCVCVYACPYAAPTTILPGMESKFSWLMK